MLGGRVRLMQPRRGYRVAIDPVLLAAAVPAHAAERVLDLGCGTGAASLCLARRVADIAILGLELQPALAALARQSAALNAMDDRIQILAGDLLTPPAAIAAASFDHVMANPPYRRADAADPSPDRSKAIATVEGAADLSCWIGAALRFVRPSGCITLIHDADRLGEIEALLTAGALEILPLHPKAGAEPKRVIVRFRPGATPARRVSPGLVLHGEDGRFTAAADAVLRAGAPLE